MHDTPVHRTRVQRPATSTHTNGASVATDNCGSLVVERIEHRDIRIDLITLNRPRERNPLDALTVRDLRRVLTKVDQEGDSHAVVLTGAGSAFSSGGDLKGYQSLYRDREAFADFMKEFEAVCLLLERTLPLSISMINGTCVAGGLELALACDLITIADSAEVGDGHLRFAQLPGAGGSQRLPRAIGLQRAKVWLLTGDLYSAEVAVQSGLATLAAPLDKLRNSTFDLAAKVARYSPLALQYMKRLNALAATVPLDEGLARERELVHEYATASHDATEGLMAFAEKREPRYQGR